MGQRTSTELHARVHRANCRDLVACPFCGAAAGDKCIGARGQPRYSSHVERWQMFDPSYVAARAKRTKEPKVPRPKRACMADEFQPIKD